MGVIHVQVYLYQSYHVVSYIILGLKSNFSSLDMYSHDNLSMYYHQCASAYRRILCPMVVQSFGDKATSFHSHDVCSSSSSVRSSARATKKVCACV